MNPLLLDYFMKLRGFTNDDMAEKLNIDPSTWYRKKSGISDFTRKEMQQIRTILSLTHVDVDNIFFGDQLA